MTDIFKSLLEVTLFSSAMILVVLSIKAVFGKRIGIRLISVLWMLTLARLILPITIESPVHLISTTQETVSEAAPQVSEMELPQSHQLNQSTYNNWEDIYCQNTDFTNQNENTSAAATQSISSPTSFQKILTFLKSISVWTYAFTVWVIGAVIMLVSHLVQMISFSRKVSDCGQTDNTDLNSLLLQNKTALGLEKTVLIAECSSVDMPVTLGIIKPKILIPKGYTQTIGYTQLSLMIMHELCHIKRSDIFKNYLWLFAKIIHWFNPLVMFAFKAYRDDIEIACDEMVVRHVSEESKFEYSQGLLEAIKLSRNEIKTPAAMSFCKDRTKLRERVETMIKPKRKSKTAAVTAILMATVMVLACFTTACQPLEKEVAIGKNEDLSETVVETNKEESLPELEESKQVVNEQIKKVNGHIEMQIDPNDMVTINVDADIIAPNMEKFTIVRIKPKNFTQEQFEILMDIVTDGEPVYYDDFSRAICLSKEEILAVLPKYKTFAQNEALPDYIKNHLDSNIEEMEKYFNVAVSMADEQLYDGTLTPMKNNTLFSYITNLKCYMGKDTAARFSFYQSFNGTSTLMQFYNEECGMPYNRFEPYTGVDAERISMTYDDAKAMAYELVCAIDGEDTNMVIYDSAINYSVGSFADNTKETSPQAYSFEFARQYNGVEIKPVLYLMGGNQQISNNMFISPESISIMIDNTGFCYINWNNHTQYIETVAEDTQLMPIDEIQEIFEQQCRNEFSWVPQNDALIEQPTVTLNVKRVELNFMVIQEKDNPESYISVPVWDFIADEVYDWEAVSQDGYPDVGLKNVSIMTINAIDGTVIDQEQGD